MEYFEVPEANPGMDGICSDNECPCGYPGATIPRGTGYIYVSQAVVDFRQDARTVAQAENKMAMMQAMSPGTMMFGQDVVTSTLMCEQGARKRGLDLEVAAADAKHWWETGLVPLRATPLASG
jgi:ribosomal protein L24E